MGTDRCLSACHSHDKIRRDFEASTMGAQLSPETGLPLVDCESCHGPGSLAIEGITAEKVQEAKAEGQELACKYETLIDLKALPAGALSLICLKCHTANATFNLHDWSSSAHAMAEVSCSDCHRIHAGPDLIVHPEETAKMCYECHQNVRAEFSLPSRHPVPEAKVFCTDCHEPHGTSSPRMLRAETVRATCLRCHGEKGGPYVYEHAENTEDCLGCHANHGSPNNYLLNVKVPFLCLQCHEGHSTDTAEARQAHFTRCTDCHSQIHGTDVPGAGGEGTFTQ